MKKLFFFILILLIPASITTIKADDNNELPVVSAFNPGHSNLNIFINNKPIPYEVFSTFVMPGSDVEIRQRSNSRNQLWIHAESGMVKKSSQNTWSWKAPSKPGVYKLNITNLNDGTSSKVNMFVLTPASRMQGEYLNGYRIGHYPTEPLRGNPAYLPPQGFIEVTRENQHTFVSPHFKLSQFLCKQEGNFPKYVLLTESLLTKLEFTLEQVNDHGIHTQSFTVMSGYRTPYYNARIGNGRYSRHIYGDAADIFLDTTYNGMMDDLNGDGKIDIEDAKILFDIIEGIQQAGHELIDDGGLGLYDKRPWRGPFVHVDTRGHQARWYQ